MWFLLTACTPPDYVDRDPVPADPPTPLPRATGLVINEVMTDNESTYQDQDFGFPDWVELYNAGLEPVDLGTARMWDSSGDVWRGPDATLLPGEHLIVPCDGAAIEGHAPFSLAGSGETLDLALDGRVIDRIATGDLPSDIAWARYPDGGAWDYTARATPNSSNGRRGIHSSDPRDGLYTRDYIPEVRLEILPSDLEQLDTGWGSTRVKVPAQLTFEGVHVGQVGVRLKGSGSWQPVSGKAAWKIDVNYYDPEKRVRQMKGITLNNGVHDATFTHEWITYELYRAAGIPAPRVGWMKLYLNGEYYGLYMDVETYDDQFIEYWYPENPDGELYEGFGDFSRGQEQWFHYEEGPEVQDLSKLTAVTEALDRPADDAGIQNLAHLVDMDHFLRYAALESIALHWDGYESPNNWRFYINPVSGLIEFLPTGVDWCWSENWAQDPWYGNGRVLRYCLQNDNCRHDFDEKLIEMAELVESMNLVEDFSDIVTWLDEDIREEPRRTHGDAEIDLERAKTIGHLTTWPAVVKQQALLDLTR